MGVILVATTQISFLSPIMYEEYRTTKYSFHPENLLSIWSSTKVHCLKGYDMHKYDFSRTYRKQSISNCLILVKNIKKFYRTINVVIFKTKIDYLWLHAMRWQWTKLQTMHNTSKLNTFSKMLKRTRLGAILRQICQLLILVSLEFTEPILMKFRIRIHWY